MNTRLIFVRHGETHKNVAAVLHGRKDDAPLNETGRSQATRSIEALARLKPVKIYSSTEIRARGTAAILNRDGLPVEFVEDLSERNWGIFRGRPWSEAESILSRMSLEERYRFKPESGESWQEVESRLVKAIERILRENPGRTVAIITHGGTIRTLLPYLLGVAREESFKYQPRHLSFSVFDFEDGHFSKVVVDDVSHLD